MGRVTGDISRHRMAPECATHMVFVKGDVKRLVCVDVDGVVVLGLFRWRPYKTPDGQVIQEKLIPIVPPHSLLKDLDVVFTELHGADFALGRVHCVRSRWWLWRLCILPPVRTSEFDVKLAIDELVSLEHLPQAAPFLRDAFARAWLAEWEVVVVVRLLGVVVWSDLVHPQSHSIAHDVLCGGSGACTSSKNTSMQCSCSWRANLVASLVCVHRLNAAADQHCDARCVHYDLAGCVMHGDG